MDQMTAIRLFVLAIEHGSLAAAGRKLDVSSAMAGRYLQSLENRLGARLIQRSTRQLMLTEVGRLYHARCKRILAEIDDAEREVADRDRALLGVLRVAAPVTFGSKCLGSNVSEYLKLHPGIRIDLSLSDCHVDLLASGIDVAIRIGEIWDQNLTVRRLANCRMMACASPSYLSIHGEPKLPSDLERHACLAFKGATSSGDWTFLDAEGAQRAPNIEPRLLADNMDLLTSAAVSGAGIAYGPEFAFVDALRAGALVPVLTGLRAGMLPVHAVYPTARYIPKMVREFVDQLARDFDCVPPWQVQPI
ncbi:LysR family transcriptional regulator [Stenotrophomonas sp. 22692]|uniref:LysR family transcriptional regulator n=1 Tax=Stenotrophomonas sp. 22692 TaxID=3453956 RepID=UPI00289A0C5F|nr:LysR family transcriptional regulator [Stenotrophomonas geniculata]